MMMDFVPFDVMCAGRKIKRDERTMRKVMVFVMVRKS
jgi:hypothetical protein